MFKKIRRYLVLQLIPYGFWFTMGAGVLVVYLAFTGYSCRLDDRSMTQAALRLVEEELILVSEPYGPQRPETGPAVREDWLPTEANVNTTRFRLLNQAQQDLGLVNPL